MPTIHPTAFVSSECEIGEGVEIGPHCTIQGKVTLGSGTRLIAAVHISGPVRIGERCTFYPGSCIGFPGQDVKFTPGMPTPGVIIGTDCIFREHSTVHAATKPEAPTTIGNRAFLMVNAHVGHDAAVGNNVTMVNNSALGGHVVVQDNVTLGGGALIHQFDRVGRLAFIGGGSIMAVDIPPFCIAVKRNELAGLNLVGLRRAGVSRDQITLLRQAYREAFRVSRQKPDMVRVLSEFGVDCPPALEMAKFVQDCKRAIAVHRGGDDQELAEA